MANKKMTEITKRLEAGVLGIFESGRYEEYLKFMSKFHSYSANNCILIMLQHPTATLVAGYRAWQKMKRQVRKGEKAIKIIAPCRYKADDEEEKIFFRVANVFAIDQTDGEELPTLGVSELNGNVEGYRQLFEALMAACPVPVILEDLPGEAKGCYDETLKQITVQSGMSEAQTLKTLIHEMAHQMLHASHVEGSKELDRETKEVQAESIAYAVCNYLGIDTAEYSFGYIAEWSSGKDAKELKASLETIRKTASRLIVSIDEIAA